MEIGKFADDADDGMDLELYVWASTRELPGSDIKSV